MFIDKLIFHTTTVQLQIVHKNPILCILFFMKIVNFKDNHQKQDVGFFL